jgi:septation ring formation regulator EzrA
MSKETDQSLSELEKKIKKLKLKIKALESEFDKLSCNLNSNPQEVFKQARKRKTHSERLLQKLNRARAKLEGLDPKLKTLEEKFNAKKTKKKT